MLFKVGEVSKKIGMSIRALHHYDVQKSAIILMMFTGRVGPLTLAFAWYSSRKRSITYAEESVMVG